MKDYATHNMREIELAREVGRKRNRAGQAAKANERIHAALEFGPVRPIGSKLCGELAWHNAFTGQRTLLEIWKEPDRSRFRFAVYVDGKRWRNGWSRSAFAAFMMEKIDRLLIDWQ